MAEVASASWRRRLVFALRLVATAVLVVLVVRFVEPRALLDRLAGADPRFLLLILLLRPLIYLVRGWRFWHLAQADAEAPLPMGRAIGWHFVSLNLGTFTPAGLGEVSLVYLMRREGFAASSTLAAMVLDKILTLALVTAMGAVGAVLYLGVDPRWLIALAVGFAALVLLAFALRRLIDRVRERAEGRRRRLLDALALVVGFAEAHPVTLGLNVVAAVVQSLLFTAQIWLGFRMFASTVDFAGVFWLSGLGRLVNMLPVTLGGLGVYEGSMVLLLERLGAAREIAFAAVLVPRTITWLVAGLVIAGALWWRAVPLGETR